MNTADTSHTAITDERARRFVARAHGLRTLGFTLGTLIFGTVLYRNGAPLPIWGLLLAHGFVWPHLARLIARFSKAPARVEQFNVMADAVMIGVWIALIRFNLLPSVLIATMFAMALIAIDGIRLLLLGSALLTVACGVAAASTGFSIAPRTDTVELLACLPLLVLFPLALASITHRLARRVQSQNRQLFQMSSIDSLSGLLNRRHWEDAVNATLARHCCDDAVMLLIDIDNFKQVNDQHGHTAGDEVVRKVGAIIRKSLREGDLAGRYGGDEFAVVLCGAGMHAAAVVAERIRSGVACSLVERAPGLRCTLSIGLARSGAAIRNASEWVKEADAAMYRAKLAGRNRLVVAN